MASYFTISQTFKVPFSLPATIVAPSGDRAIDQSSSLGFPQYVACTFLVAKSHTLTSPAAPADTSRDSSAEIAMDREPALCPLSIAISRPFVGSCSQTKSPPLANVVPSRKNARELANERKPFNVCPAVPVSTFEIRTTSRSNPPLATHLPSGEKATHQSWLSETFRDLTAAPVSAFQIETPLAL